MNLIVGIVLFLAAVSISLYLWMLWPASSAQAMRQRMEGKKFAHRGVYDNKGEAPENSMKAFAAAVDKGYAIEMDIRLANDGEVVIFHDETLARMCGLQKQIGTLTLAELRKLHLLGSEEKIPTFKEFLELVAGRVPLLVEFKTGLPGSEDVSQLCRMTMQLLDTYEGEYFVESFDYQVLEWFRKNRPGVMRGQLGMGFRCYVPAIGKKNADAIPLHRRRMISWLLYNFRSRPHFISYRFQDAGLNLRLCSLLGVAVSVWTVRKTGGFRAASAEV